MFLIDSVHCIVPRAPLLLLTALVAVSCSGGKRNEWDAIDYSSVYRKAAQKENDSNYTPSGIGGGGCLEDDFGC